MGTRDGIPALAMGELLRAMASGDRIRQAEVGLATSTLASDSLEVAGAMLDLLPGARIALGGATVLDLGTPRGPARILASAGRVAAGEPGMAPCEVRAPWIDVGASYELGRRWHHGVRHVHDPHAAMCLFGPLREAVASAGAAREAHRRSQAYAHRHWAMPDSDRRSFAAVRLGTLVASHHGHMPPGDALDPLHARAVEMEGSAAVAAAMRLFAHCDAAGGPWVLPGLHARAWKARDRDVLSLVSTAGRRGHASLVAWRPSASSPDAEVEVSTMPGEGPPERHLGMRVRDGRARCVGPVPGIHAHAAVRLLARRVEASLAVVDALAAVHDLHAILGL